MASGSVALRPIEFADEVPSYAVVYLLENGFTCLLSVAINCDFGIWYGKSATYLTYSISYIRLANRMIRCIGCQHELSDITDTDSNY